MLNGNIDNITAPVRTIGAKVEVVNTSTKTLKGEALRIEDCKPGTALEIQLASRNLIDMTRVHNNSSGCTILEKTEDYVLAQGKEGAAAGTLAWSTGNLVFPLAETAKNGKTYTVSFDIEYIEQTVPFDLPVAMGMIFANTVASNIGSLTGMGTYHIERTYTLTRDVTYITLYPQSCKVKVSNLIVCEGTNTAFTPFLRENDFADIELFQYGKNLIDFSGRLVKRNYGVQYLKNNVVTTDINYLYIDEYVPIAHLQGLKITTNYAVSTYNANSTLGFAFYDTNKTHIGGTKDTTFTVPNNAVYGRFTFAPNCPGVEAIQFELGNAVTEYELPTEAQVFTPEPDGTVKGLTALANNSIFAYPPGAVLTVKYAVDTVTETYTSSDRIKAITFDRTGENKFFGFGVCQKANVKLLDKERDCTLTAGNTILFAFDDVGISSKMRISEIHRDEVTNELSVTAYDALGQAADKTYEELQLSSYTLSKLAEAVANALGIGFVLPTYSEFSIYYADGGNFDGAENLREVLNAIAEVTQTVYYINKDNKLVFKRFNKDEQADYTIDKEQYFSLKNNGNKRLAAICSATELGDNVIAEEAFSGSTQYLRNNPLLELREDLASILDNALANMGGLTINQFDCDWRGNYLLEPCDKLALISKDGTEFYSYLVNDTISYNGGYKQNTSWEFETDETEHDNPTNLGELLKSTYAKVDKANKEIEIVASETAENASNIAAIRADTESINASVSSVEKKLNDNIEIINGNVVELTNKVEATMTSEEIEFKIQNELSNGVDKVTTTQGYTFDNEGLKVTNSGNNFSTTITENGMTVKEGSKEVLTASNEGVTAVDLHAKTFLIIGKYSRFEDYGSKKRTACFWIG